MNDVAEVGAPAVISVPRGDMYRYGSNMSALITVVFK